MVRSVHGEMSHAQAGCSSPRRAEPVAEPDGEVAAGAVAADRDRPRRDPLPAEPPPRGHRVLVRRRERMLRRQPVGDRERPHPRRPPGLRHQPPVAQDRARAEPAAVEEDQHPRRVAPRRQREFAGHAVDVRRLEPDVVGDRPCRADLLDPRPPLGPAGGPRLGGQHLADRVDLGPAHSPLPLCLIMRTLSHATASSREPPMDTATTDVNQVLTFGREKLARKQLLFAAIAAGVGVAQRARRRRRRRAVPMSAGA